MPVVPARTRLLVAALSLAPAALPAQLVTNGGFEAPLAPPGFYTLLPTGTGFAGWEVVGARGNVANVSTTYASAGSHFPAHGGAQWMDLTGLTNTATGIRQTVATTPGTQYLLSFWVGNVVNPPGYGTSSSIAVLLDGAPLLTATHAGGGLNQTWQLFTHAFTAAGTATTLAFMNADPASDNTNGLDDVTLTAVPAAPTTAPEPGGAALLAAGLLALAAGARSRRGSPEHSSRARSPGRWSPSRRGKLPASA